MDRSRAIEMRRSGASAASVEDGDGKGTKRVRSEADVRWMYYAKALTYLLAWSLVSGLIIILNNWILHYDHFPFPITLSASGPLFSWLVAATLVATGHTKLERRMTFGLWLRNIFPIGFFTAITYATGNELYMFLSVSFIQMMKSLSPIVVLFLLVLFRLDVLTREKLAGVLIMSVGMIIACFDEPTFSMWGIALMVVGEAAEAMRMVFFQHLLGQQQFGLIEGLFYTCPANFFFLCIGIAVFEEKSLTEPENYGRVVNNPLPYVVVSCMGFGVILTTLGVIQTCGSLTFKAAGQVRNVGIVFVSIVMFGDVVTAQQACGYAINLIGFFMYQYVKSREDLAALEAKRVEAMGGGEPGGGESGGASAGGGGGGGGGGGDDDDTRPLLRGGGGDDDYGSGGGAGGGAGRSDADSTPLRRMPSTPVFSNVAHR